MPSHDSHTVRAWLANSSQTTMAPASAPNSGRMSSLRVSDVRASRSSLVGVDGRGGHRNLAWLRSVAAGATVAVAPAATVGR